MNKTLILAASALSMVSAPAFAQVAQAPSAAAQIQLSAKVDKACGVGNHLSGADSAPGWDTADINVTLNEGNGQFDGVEFTNRSWGNVWCNGSATVRLDVEALTTNATTTDTGSFSSRFDVEVTTDAGVYMGKGQDLVISTAGTGDGKAFESGNSGGAFETGLQRFGGADKIKILPAKSQSGTNLRPVAGNYKGLIKFTASVS